MDIATLIKKLDISGVKVAFLGLFNKAALHDYVIDKAWIAAVALLTLWQATAASNIRQADLLSGTSIFPVRPHVFPVRFNPYSRVPPLQKIP